ncbi:MAG: putative Rossmann fold flavoprotein [Burkholderiaceae bacterium]|jgi:predicted Rossmann fold flavoprotein
MNIESASAVASLQVQTPYKDFDTIIIGAGAAGLMCAGVAGQLGLKVLLLDHAVKIAEKIRISGGGRCNFTNRDLDPRNPQTHFISDNPRFCKHALGNYTPDDFLALMAKHQLSHTEKHKGQLFCDQSAGAIITMLLDEAKQGGVDHRQGIQVKAVSKQGDVYQVHTSQGNFTATNLVVATGGLSIPKIGATDFGYGLAKQFDMPLIPTRPALVPLTFDGSEWTAFKDLAGVALPVHIQMTGASNVDKTSFYEDLLFTHKGLSGPAILQISSYWQPGLDLRINLHTESNLDTSFSGLKATSRKQLGNELAALLPARLAQQWLQGDAQLAALRERPMVDMPDKALRKLAESLHQWRIKPSGSEGYAKAEVTAGGVDTRALDAKTMQAKGHTGLYFIGEVTDVTGWLGGYNFQWAWASGYAAAKAMATGTV